MATQTVQATNTAPKKKSKLTPIVCFIVTVILAVLFVYPVYFAVISAFKSNGEILKAPSPPHPSCTCRTSRTCCQD